MTTLLQIYTILSVLFSVAFALGLFTRRVARCSRCRRDMGGVVRGRLYCTCCEPPGRRKPVSRRMSKLFRTNS